MDCSYLQRYSSINHYRLPVNLDRRLRNGSRKREAAVVLSADALVRSHPNRHGSQRKFVSGVSDQIHLGIQSQCKLCYPILVALRRLEDLSEDLLVFFGFEFLEMPPFKIESKFLNQSSFQCSRNIEYHSPAGGLFQWRNLDLA